MRPYLAAAAVLVFMAAIGGVVFAEDRAAEDRAAEGRAAEGRAAEGRAAEDRATATSIAAGVNGAVAIGAASALGSPGGEYDLARLRTLALERSTALRAALLSADAALLQEGIDSRKLLPSIEARAGGSLSYELCGGFGASASASLGLGQILYDGGRSRLQTAIDSLASAEAREEARAAALAALGEVDGAYYDVLEAEASVEAARGDLAAAGARLELATAKSELGVISRLDLLEAEADAASRETALSQAGKALALARSKLASIAGTSPGAAYAAVEAAPYDELAGRLAALSDAEGLVARLAARAEAASPSLASSRLAERRTGREAELAARQYWPQVSASYSHSMGYGSGSGLSAGSGSLSIAASLSIAPWGAADDKKSAAIAASRAALEVEEAERSLDLGLRESVYGCLAASRSLRSSRLALEYAESYYSSVLELYRLSMTSTDKLSEAEALVSSSRKALIAARFELLGLVTGLGRAVGVEEEGLLLSLFE